MKVNYFTFLILVFINSCGQKSTVEVGLPKIEQISISISEEQLNSYQVLNSYSENGTNKLIAYNGARHSLDYFDLDAAKAIKSDKLTSDGPSGVGKIESVYWHNADSIFIYERGKVHLMKEGGEKSTTYDLYELFNAKNLGEPVCNFYFKLKYNGEKKELYFSLIHHKASLEERGTLPLIASLNLENFSIEALPIYHTNHYRDLSGKVGFITYLGFQDFLRDQMIYNFQYESTLFSYDFDSQKMKQGESHEMKFVPELFEQEDPSAFDLHAIENNHFLTSIPDNWRNIVYRGTWDSPDPTLNESGFTEKKISISVFDPDLNFLSKFELPNYTYQINNWFVNENGLYLNYAHPRNDKVSEDFLVFHVFQFDQPNGQK